MGLTVFRPIELFQLQVLKKHSLMAHRLNKEPQKLDTENTRSFLIIPLSSKHGYTGSVLVIFVSM